VKRGRQAATLSGGEAQRVELSKALSRRANGRALHILGEPTTGPRFEDVRAPREAPRELADQDATVVVIEHNPDVAKTADRILDFGPEGGGGEIVAAGTPEQMAKARESWTGRYLLGAVLARDGARSPPAAKAKRVRRGARA
jgi:excinuclease ABC subunit A